MSETVTQSPRSFANSAARTVEIALNFWIAALISAIFIYAGWGRVGFWLADYMAGNPEFRILIKNATKPAVIFILVGSVRYGLWLLRRRRWPEEDAQNKGSLAERAKKEMGPPTLAVSVLASLYIIYFYAIAPMGHALGDALQIESHKKDLAEAAAAIPQNATVYATSGAYFEAFRGFPDARPLLGVEAAQADAGGKGIYMVVDTFLGPSRKGIEAHALMTDSEYHLVFFRKDLYVFAPGKKGGVDYETYIRDFLSFPAIGAEHQVGRHRLDPEAPGGVALQATPKVDKPGFLIYGRYMTLKKGTHMAVFRLKVKKKIRGAVAELDVAADNGQTILAKRKVRGGEFFKEKQWQEFRLEFETDKQVEQTAQLRVSFMGGADLFFSNMYALPDKKSFSD